MRKPGFTLVEVLMASALSVVLISTVYLAIDMSWRYSSAGQEEVEQVLIARTLLMRFEKDLHSLMDRDFDDRQQVEFEPEDLGRISEHSNMAHVKSGVADRRLNDIEIVGSRDAIVIRPHTTPLQRQGDVDQHSPLVLYAVACNGEVTLPDLSSDILSRSLRMGASSVQSGMVRMELLHDGRGETLRPSNAGANSEVLAEEVSDLRFRFFDGTAWQDEWSGESSRGLPSAVEVTLRLVDATAETNAQRGSGFETYRRVIAIPAASVGYDFPEKAGESRTSRG